MVVLPPHQPLPFLPFLSKMVTPQQTLSKKATQPLRILHVRFSTQVHAQYVPSLTTMTVSWTPWPPIANGMMISEQMFQA
jgi:hypothetical protein